jgi:hypothetical protein
MLHKVALAVGGLAAAGVLALALGAAGFTPGAAASKLADAVTLPAVAQDPQTKTVTDTVYVEPTPQPKIIHVTKPAATPPHQQRVETIVRSQHHGEGDESGGDGERGGDD